MFSATNPTTVLGSPKDPKTAPSETMFNAKNYAPRARLESMCSSRPVVTMPTMIWTSEKPDKANFACEAFSEVRLRIA